MNPTGRPLALAVLADLPHPPRSGNHLRDLQTLALLDLIGYDVAVVAADRDWAGERSIGPHGRLHKRVAVPAETTTASARARRIARLLRAALGTRPVSPWALAYDDAGFCNHVALAVAELTPDALVLRSTFAHLGPELRSRVRFLVFDVHDAETLLARSLLSLHDPLRTPVAALRVAAGWWVDRLIATADEAWVPSPRELEHLRPLARTTRILVVPSSVRMPERLPERPDRRRKDLLLVGGFGYPPNAAAARRLVEEILPRVRDQHPDVRVVLVGRDLSPVLFEHWRDLPVCWLGVVDDLASVFQDAAAFVLPYDPTTQTGTPLKVADAIAHGVPVVATPNATAPLGLIAEEHVLTGESPAELADAVCRVLDDDEDARKRSRRAHAWARAHLDSCESARRLKHESVLARALVA
jgi:glycosyltransferase involved in cell wall biosynthesis